MTDERALAREVIEHIASERAHRQRLRLRLRLRLEIVAWDKPDAGTGDARQFVEQPTVAPGTLTPSDHPSHYP